MVASLNNIYCYTMSTSSYASSNLLQTISLNNGNGVLDLSSDGLLIAYVNNQSNLSIATGWPGSYTTVQTIITNSTIRGVVVSEEKWLLLIVSGDSQILLYANNTNNFTFVASYSIDGKIEKIDLA